ncbi:MAG: hypothetical protein FWF08_01065, partial [Oscillospiraceae bacterium]|nr:hypothetical protein [Oscillospiraceae bacterium]
MEKLHIKNRINPSALAAARDLAGQAFYAAIAFIMTGAGVFSDLSPFGIAFCAAVKPYYLPFSMFGAAAGYLISRPGVFSLRYVAGLL